MKKLILTTNLILIAIAMVSTLAFAAKTSIRYRTLNAHTFKAQTKKKKKVAAQRPMYSGQKTIICGKAGATITNALSNIQSDLAQSSVKSHTEKNLTIQQPFKAVEAPIVHSEKRKRTADVYIACVKIRKV